jgi:hypothetical protein
MHIAPSGTLTTLEQSDSSVLALCHASFVRVQFITIDTVNITCTHACICISVAVLELIPETETIGSRFGQIMNCFGKTRTLDHGASSVFSAALIRHDLIMFSGCLSCWNEDSLDAKDTDVTENGWKVAFDDLQIQDSLSRSPSPCHVGWHCNIQELVLLTVHVSSRDLFRYT